MDLVSLILDKLEAYGFKSDTHPLSAIAEDITESVLSYIGENVRMKVKIDGKELTEETDLSVILYDIK
jgi:hypothetical protein